MQQVVVAMAGQVVNLGYWQTPICSTWQSSFAADCFSGQARHLCNPECLVMCDGTCTQWTQYILGKQAGRGHHHQHHHHPHHHHQVCGPARLAELQWGQGRSLISGTGGPHHHTASGPNIQDLGIWRCRNYSAGRGKCYTSVSFLSFCNWTWTLH